MMNSQRWCQIQELYYSALSLNQHERSKLIADTCGSDTVLRDEVISLLHSDESSGDFLEKPILQVGLQVLVDSSLRSAETDCSVEEPALNNLVGSTIDGRYQIIEKLGSGGVGEVYRARDTKILSRIVVIKVLKDSSLARPWIVAKFQQEIEALTKIADPGVVGIIDVGKLPEGKPYLVMELVEGCNLREFIQRNQSGCLAFHEIAEIVKQVGRTITSAHHAGVIHRDLKPANIMVRRNASGDLQVKVIDFGIAKITSSVMGDHTTTGLVAGTVHYMAPEQLRGQPVQPASDVYALGVITYEMVTGTRPFNPEGFALLPELQRDGVKVVPRDLRPGLPQAAQEAILKALAYQPADRFQQARDFGDVMAQALTNGQTTNNGAKKQLTIETSPQSDRAISNEHIAVSIRKKRLAFTLVALLCLSLIGVGIYVRYSRSVIPQEDILNSMAMKHLLTYSLTVQRMRDRKPYEDPFQSSGEHIFDTGDNFRLNVKIHQAGYFYVFNEGANDKGDFTLTAIYPTPSTNSGSAGVDANQVVQTSLNEFSGQPGREQFWLIWSVAPLSDLEAARDNAFQSEKGAVTDAGLGRRVREFVLKHAELKPQITRDTTRRETVVKGSGDSLVMVLELEHH